MRLAIAKPDWRIVGGFELLLGQLTSRLEARGVEVISMPVDVPSTSRVPYGVVVPEHVWAAAPEYFRYLSVLETFRRMEFPTGTDCVVSTQPPSFAVGAHPHVSVFFHHLRIYYDLSDVYVRAGFADDDLHARAESVVRQLDQPHLDAVDRFLVASDEVASRLGAFNGIEAGLGRFCPPPILNGLDPRISDVGGRGDGPVLCVSRHEFPKRVELFVQAMHLAHGVRGVVVGTGGREPFARHVDAAFTCGAMDPNTAPPEEVWLNTGQPPAADPAVGIVEFAGRVDEPTLLASYDEASCVVAPAFREDYGLTALEAMSFGKPVIVCNDGGGLAELVEHGVTGLVVEPTAPALAAAIQRLADDGALRSDMACAARESARRFTWEAVTDAMITAVDQAVSTG